MVVKDMEVGLKMKMESQSLKFGMDRILSEEMSSGNSRSEGSCTCAGCLLSLYRCCRSTTTTTSLDMTNFYTNEIHVPQPLRPYPNVLISTEANPNPNGHQSNSIGTGGKRKRTWSRAVFSNLQRKGLEKRFQLQKYITKPDRRQLAATLGLTDAQVKVWFQNRRMKWRHAKETPREISSEKETCERADSVQSQNTDSESGSELDVQSVDN